MAKAQGKPAAVSTKKTPTGFEIVQTAFNSMQGLYDDRNMDHEGWKMPLEIARHLHGAMLSLGVKPGSEMPDSVLESFLHNIGYFNGGDRLEGDELAEEVCRLWAKVELPYGCSDPFEVATAKARSNPEPIPKNLFRIQSIQEKAAVLLGIARELAASGDGTFYLPTRRIGDALDVNFKTAAEMLRKFKDAGILIQCGERQTKKGYKPIPLWRINVNLVHSV